MTLQSSYRFCVELRLCCEKTNSENEREERDCQAGGHGVWVRFIIGQSEVKVRAHEAGKSEIWAAIACLSETRQDGIYGQVCYNHDVRKRKRKRA
jgi:hypothetical protein